MYLLMTNVEANVKTTDAIITSGVEATNPG